MSRDVSWFVPGIATAPIRITPSIAAYHAGTRGSMMKTGSPGRTPSPASAFATRRDSAAMSATVCSATVSPCGPSDTSARSSGASAAQASTMSSTGLKRSGTVTR